MTMIPDAVEKAHNEASREITTVEGLLVALDEMVAEFAPLNDPDPRATAICVLIDVIKERVGRASKLHSEEYSAWHYVRLVAAE